MELQVFIIQPSNCMIVEWVYDYDYINLVMKLNYETSTMEISIIMLALY